MSTRCFERFIVLLTIVLLSSLHGMTQPFIHPGINQGSGDLVLMKQWVERGVEPYRSAFDQLKASTDTLFQLTPYAHVLRGPYGKPNIGGESLSRSANLAYNAALLWYITNNKAYANKAIEILNGWSRALRGFDYNDAKLLAAWTGHLLINAAEILRYTRSGWAKTDIDAFSSMLISVYYPLLRQYYPQANGNWDGAIIHTIMAIGIFTDNRAIFSNALDHFLHAPFNGSLFKYIYPNGQCQETPRDQGHVQLGLGEFAGAAQVAYTQGVDLFTIADHRLGLGFEYTAQVLLGPPPACYCVISERARTLRDDYEYVYRHYTFLGLQMPWTKKAADSIRSRSPRSVLISVRKQFQQPAAKHIPLSRSMVAAKAGAGDAAGNSSIAQTIIITPGESIQKAIDEAKGQERTILLKTGIHKIPASLQLKSKISLTGEGKGTVIFLDPDSGQRDAVVNAEPDLSDVVIRDLVIEGGTRTDIPSDPNSIRSFRSSYNRGGVVFRAEYPKRMKNISLINVTIRNCTYNGVFISGAEGINIINCDLNENGSSVVPGPKLQHNLLVTYSDRVKVIGSRLNTSPYGSGVAIDHCTDFAISDCEIARNGHHGILIQESRRGSITNALIEANDHNGIMMEFLHSGSSDIRIEKNLVHYNTKYGISSYSVKNLNLSANRLIGNGSAAEQLKLTAQQQVLLQ